VASLIGSNLPCAQGAHLLTLHLLPAPDKHTTTLLISIPRRGAGLLVAAPDAARRPRAGRFGLRPKPSLCGRLANHLPLPQPLAKITQLPRVIGFVKGQESDESTGLAVEGGFIMRLG